LAYLLHKKYQVLRLDDALKQLDDGTLPDWAVVITIDDGWCGVEKYARQVLSEMSLSATLYITTYYCLKGNPVFQVAIQYVLWKTTRRYLDLCELRLPLCGRFDLADGGNRDRAATEIIQFGETKCDELERLTILERLGRLLEVDVDQLRQSRRMSLLNVDEIRLLAAQGMDIQLHTHRHRFPLDREGIHKEIMENKIILQSLLQTPLQHFCYPSGVWAIECLPWLAELGIRSAVTCEVGMNYPYTPRLSLRRFLDGEHISQIEFEAELTGFSELWRQARGAVRRLFESVSH
jgi:peptidoglycan/xylan/chitin deacetylase (PgdA/CDA1 family)